MQRTWSRMHPLFAVVALLVVSSIRDSRADTVFGVAGVPKALGQSRDYDRIFSTLTAAGIATFFPIFQYVEHPAAKTLGFEPDFAPPCTPQSPAFAALRRHAIRLVLAADTLYPRGRVLPAIEDDPLRAVIACAGRENVHGVLAYDEPVHQGVTEDEVAGVFARVKAVDPTLPVLMVHAPMLADEARYATTAGRSGYLKSVARYSRHADVVGFDVYPIPRDIAKVTAPDSDGRVVGYAAAVTGYLAWLKREMPDRRLMIVLQGFSYVDQFEPDFLPSIASAATLRGVAPPTAAETAEMTRLSMAAGAETVFWWGPSLVRDVDAGPWPGIVGTVRSLTANR